MEILVCIKQVPGTTSVEVDPVTGVLKRDGIEAKMNPYDLYALELLIMIFTALPPWYGVVVFVAIMIVWVIILYISYIHNITCNPGAVKGGFLD